MFDSFGTGDSGFYMEIGGRSAIGGAAHSVRFDLTAHAGDGLLIPCIPAIVLAIRLGKDQIAMRGAHPYVGLIELDAILDELKTLRITWAVSGAPEATGA
jgi:hypothetical protein